MQRFLVGCFLAALLLCRALPGSAQPVTDGEGDMGIGTLRPHPSALLDLASASRGVLLPRMTRAQRDAISRPAPGLLLYNNTDSLIQINCGSEAEPIWCTLVRERPEGGLTARLSPGALWFGGIDSSVVELPPGPDGAVLRIDDGEPVWDMGSLLPPGTGANTTLRWNGTEWVENPNLRSDSAGNTTVEGNVTVNGSTVTMPNLPVTGAGTTVVVTDGAGNLQRIDVNDLLGNSTLSENALWVGDAANNPAEMPSTNIPGSVLQQDGTGAPVWDDDLNVNTINVDSLTVNDYANITNNVFTTDSTVFNTNVVFNDTAQFNAYTNINGVEITVDSTVSFYGGAVTINADSTVVNNVFVANDSAYFNGPTIFGDTVIFNTLPSLPLSENAMYLGNGDNVAAELATTNIPGSVLQQDGTGAPVWDDDLNVNTINVDSLTVNEYANITNNVFTTDSTVFNTNVVFNDTAQFNAYTNINGVEINVDSTVNFWNAVTINADSTVVNNVFVANDSAYFNGPTIFGDTVIFNTLPSLPLSENAMYLGNGDNVAAELATTNVPGSVLQQDGTGAPVWDDDLNVNTINVDSLTVNDYANITSNVFTTDSTVFNTNVVFNDTAQFNAYTNINGVEINVDSTVNFWNAVTINADSTVVNNVFVTNDSAYFNGPTIFGDTVIFNTLPSLPLSENAMYLGNGDNVAAELAPGTTDQVLQIDGSGSPTWQTVNLLPTGTATNTPLVWDNVAGEWVENTEVTLDPTNGNTAINGDLTVDGTTVSVPNIPATTTSTTVVVTDGSGNLQTTDINDLVDNATLTQNSIWVGDASNNPAELAPGTTDQVLQIDGSGAPTWETINLLPTGTATNTTLVWDNVAGEWIENTEVTLDPTNGNTAINGDLTVDGDATLNGTTVSVPNIPNVVTGTDVVITDGAGNLQTIDINDLVDNATLTQNNIWVGDASNNPAELAPGVTDQVLQIDGSGSPTWGTINLLPTGTATNTTLVWDNVAGEWVENTEVTLDPTNGNTAINGNLNIDGTTVSVPNIPATTTSTTVVVTDGSGNLQTTDINDLVDNATLTQNNIWVGDASNNPAELAPGTTDQVLQIDGSGAPTWQTINLLPTGTAANTTLVWDNVAGEWVENTEVTLDPTNGNTAINGNLNVDGDATLNGTTVSVPNIPNVVTGTDVVITDGAGNLQTIDINDLVDNATLTQNNIWVGDASNNPAELAPGTTDQVLQIDGSGSPTWGTINLLPTGTATNTTLVWDNVAGEWIENTEVTLDPTNGNTAINGALTVDGDATLNGATVSVPNIPNVVTGTDVVITDGAGNLQTIDINDLVDNATLTQNNIWVGDASNNPAELAPGNDGDVLTINGTTPTWTANPGGLLPGGTTLNSTLRWDGTDWVENTNLRSDASGNTVNEGTLTANGAVTATAAGNTVGDNTASRQLTVDGVADAVVGNTLAGNPAVWDQVVEGDLVATGIVKVGGSVWIDGQTADYHRIASDDDLDVGTTSDQDLTLSANGAVGLRVVGSNQRINIESELNLRGGATPLLAGGSAGTAGQALVSGGTGATPSWTTLGAANLALSQNAMLVGNASNIAAELPATANRILATNGAGVPSWSSSLPTGVTVGFDQITSGTNTAAVMNVGTGASLQPTGSGAVTANRIVGTGSTTNAVDLATAEVSGTLPINRGGTNGTATPTAGAVAYGTGTAYAFTAAGTSGNVLVSAGAGAPTWQNPNGLFWGLTGNSGTNASTNFLGTTDATRLAFRTNNTERMTLSTAGHLGLGTTNPGGIITIINDDVSDVTDDLIMATYSATYTPLLRMARARGTVAAPAQLLQNDVIGLISFSGNSATLIGAEIVAVADANHSVTDQSTRLEFVTNDGTTTATRMTIDDDGRVGIGTTTPNAAVFLHVVGDAGKTAGGTTWVNLSDGRMKDVQGDYTKGLAEIIGLKPVVYRYKPENTWGAPSDVDQYGFIAQEVETVFPEAVSTGEDGYLVFNMHPILVAYANAVKELNEKVETLEEEKAEMMDLLEELRSRVEALEGN